LSQSATALLATSALVVSRTVRSTIGDGTFLATAASVWNSLRSQLLKVTRRRLKTELFAPSYCSYFDQQSGLEKPGFSYFFLVASF